MNSDIVKAFHGCRKFLNKRIAKSFVHTEGWHKFDSLEEINECFIGLRDKYNVATDEDKYIYDKLNAAVTYLQHMNGTEFSYEQYLTLTIGLKPKVFSEARIDRLIEDIKSEFKDLGIEYNQDSIIKGFYNIHLTEEDIKASLESEMKRMVEKAEKYLGIKLDEPVDIEFINQDIPYSYFLNIKEEGYSLKVNLNNKNVMFSKASLKYAIAHEICGHALQLSSWKKQIHNHKISEVCGCEEDYGPEIFQLEGVGESVVYFIFQDEIDKYMKVELMIDELHHLVQNNAYIKVNNSESIEEVTRYYSERYILSKEEDIKKRLILARDDAFYRANLYVYGVSLDFFKSASKQLNEEEKRLFFRKMYLQPMTYQQIKSCIIGKYF